MEWDYECQQELSTLADGIGQDFCIFGDVSSFWRPELQEVVEALEKQPHFSVEVLSGLIKSRKAMRRSAWCVRHGKVCHLATARKHSAGSSCTAHSAQGLRLGLSDKNVLHLLSWIGQRLECQEGEIDLENVSGFPTDVILRFFTEYYHVEVALLDPRVFGTLGIWNYIKIFKGGRGKKQSNQFIVERHVEYRYCTTQKTLS